MTESTEKTEQGPTANPIRIILRDELSDADLEAVAAGTASASSRGPTDLPSSQPKLRS